MANDVLIKIKTTFDGKGFNKLRSDASKAKKAISKSFNDLGVQVTSAMALTSVVRGLKNFTLESIQVASEAERVESAFLNLSGGSEAAAKNMQAMQIATHGLTSEMEAQQIANQLLGMQIVGNAAELEKVVSVAGRLGGTFRGLGTKEAAEEFAIMISNMSVQRLDSFGISSGRVKKRIKELMDETKGMTKEQAFFQATMEEAEDTMARLGPRVETTADQLAGLNASTTDFKVAFGDLITSGGVIEWADGVVEALARGAQSWGVFLDQATLVQEATNSVTAQLDEGTQAYLDYAKSIPVAGGMISFAENIANMIFPTEAFTDSLVEAAEKQTEFDQALVDSAAARQTAKIETEAAPNEQLIKAQEEMARSLVQINRDAADEIPEIWDTFFDGVSDAWETFRDDLEKIDDEAAKQQLENEEDLAKDLAKVKTNLAKSLASINKDLAKDLAKSSKKEQKDIIKKQSSFSKDRTNQEKRRQIDTLSDQRLFDFELRNLAADGQGNRIRELLERRSIEQDIAREKNALESQIDQQKQTEEIESIKETASERRNQLILDAQEERAQKTTDAQEERARLNADAEEEAARLGAELDEQRATVAQNLQDELTDLMVNKDEKLAVNEQSRLDNIAKLGEELAESQELTKEELGKITEIAGRSGADAGAAFANGLSQGIETNLMVEELITGIVSGEGGLGGAATSGRQGRRRGERSQLTDLQKRNGLQHGGSFTVGGSGGPDSQLVQFAATPGEVVTATPPGQSANNVTVNVNGIGAADLVAILEGKVSEGIQEYQDNFLVPVLAGL